MFAYNNIHVNHVQPEKLDDAALYSNAEILTLEEYINVNKNPSIRSNIAFYDSIR